MLMKMILVFMLLPWAFQDGKIWIKSINLAIDRHQDIKIFLFGILIGENMVGHQE